MKILKAALAASFLSFSTPSIADEDVGDRNVCVLLGSYARTVMTARQSGLTLSGVLEAADGTVFGDLERLIAIKAFEETRYMTPDMQRRATVDFGNEIELECYKSQL